jgi:PAS domain S-box-containing protein
LPTKNLDGLSYLLWVPIILGLYVLSQTNYLLFHSLAEMFSIIIACCIFILAWNSRKFSTQPYLLLVGIGYLFVAFIDLFHTFSYKGLSVFPGYDADLPTQLWIAARYLESLTFVGALYIFRRKLHINVMFVVYGLITFLIFASLFWWKTFPACYIEGSGLTPFKKISEYLISGLWILAICSILREKKEFDSQVLQLLVASMFASIASELFFTIYISVFGLANFIGHILKIISFYLVYKASIVTNLTRPYQSMFRELKLNEMRFRSIYKTAPLAFVVWDSECRITDWNKTAERMFGWSAQEVIGRNFFDFLIPAKAREQVQSIKDALAQGMMSNRSINDNKTRDGRTIICEWNNSVLTDEEGRPEMVLSLALDITDKLKAEQTIKESTENIKNFAYTIVHDLKSPVASMHGLVNLLTKRYGDSMDEKARLYCNQIVKVAEQVNSLVENINIYIKTKEFPRKIESVDLQQVLAEIRDEFGHLLTSSGVELTGTETLPAIQADRTDLTRVFRNLVDNALKYGGEKLSKITIGYKEDVEQHIISVADDGIGMKKEDAEGIFDIFTRSASVGNASGSGLGLAIVREIAEKADGAVWADLQPGKGATFYISISKDLA